MSDEPTPRYDPAAAARARAERDATLIDAIKQVFGFGKPQQINAPDDAAMVAAHLEQMKRT